jgi:stalled ribosome alternative rescue factor ArfA
MGKTLLSQAVKLEDVRREDMFRQYLAQLKKGTGYFSREIKEIRKDRKGK